jgi:malate synthase
METRVLRAELQVDSRLAGFIETEALPGSGVAAAAFWTGLAEAVATLDPAIKAAVAQRAALQAQIDAWHRARAGQPHDPAATRAFLAAIGYLVPEVPAFAIETEGTDPEIARVAGPQLVVPVANARYALNAANARFGSLYDALYGTDALVDAPPPGPYDPTRGARVVAWGRSFLDATFPLAAGSWAAATALTVAEGRLAVTLGDGATRPADPLAFAGHQGDAAAPSRLLLRHHGLCVELVLDRNHPIGAGDGAGIADIRLEAALSTILDLEDSVAAVDAADKVAAYANWLGLMRGDLAETFTRNGRPVTRRLNADASYTAPDGRPLTLRTRALMLVRNVGHLMTTPAILNPAGAEIGEGILDAFVTVLAACHDLRRPDGPHNSPAGSVYVVKPKLHGPDEVALAVRLFDAVERALDLPAGTVKLGIMDEERRTSATLRACIFAARRRIAFINTGFLDRTGDEIHTGMEAGPMVPKAAMKSQAWLAAYEARNVATGLACGMPGRAQIGKGMWAAPDRMAAMLAEKGAHPASGANTAWVPSPTAATLHAVHYHRVDVAAVQAALAANPPADDHLDALLTPPVATGPTLDAGTVQAELDNNAQGILGYVVRWVDQGVGCSKVPDIHDIALMEDRATCRISAQAIANWLHHGVVTRAQVEDTFRRMAAVVDRQNAADPAYRTMTPGCDGPAFRAALALALDGRSQPSGYTEPLLHAARLDVKKGA